MDNPIPYKPRNKFWLLFFVLFVFWYMLLYGFDWSSFRSFSAVSRNQEETPLSSSDPSKNSTDIIENSTSPFSPESRNITAPKSDTEENDAIEDLDGLQKELEPILGLPQDPDEDEEDDDDGKNKRKSKPCTGRFIYVHDLPGRFNRDLVKKCKLLNKWHDMCQYFDNVGLGPDLGNPQRLFMNSGWYTTHQFSLEVIFHNRMKQYDCLTNDSSQAAAIYVPYYPGLDISRYLWGYYSTTVRDTDSMELFKWLRKRPEWEVMGGKNHFMVAGRITWDFRRGIEEASGWGNKLMLLPEALNMTVLTIESSPWNKNDFAIPYPTYFHPSRDDQITQWQSRMRKQKRRSLFCFAGAPRPDMDDTIRGEIMEQCRRARKRCRMMECKDEKNNCMKPVNVMKMFQSSTFCLQPPGDSFTRRSTFDSILAGCIPVFFNPGSAYVQYLWHLPKDYGSYSVLISERDVKRKKVNIERVLSRISKSKVQKMRDEVIKLIPKVIYADPRSKLVVYDDAFDLTITGVLKRIEGMKKEVDNSSSVEFDEESSWKYYTFGTTEEHEWDPYFRRSNRLEAD